MNIPFSNKKKLRGPCESTKYYFQYEAHKSIRMETMFYNFPENFLKCSSYILLAPLFFLQVKYDDD